MEFTDGDVLSTRPFRPVRSRTEPESRATLVLSDGATGNRQRGAAIAGAPQT